MKEEWKDIPGHEGYQISNLGRVYNNNRKHFLTGHIKNGYISYHIQKEEYLAHRLVANAFIPNPDNLATVDHINGNKTDNDYRNLQWLSNEDNVKKANSYPVRCIETDTIYPSISEAARIFGKAKTNLSACLRGKQKTWCGYHWELVKEG